MTNYLYMLEGKIDYAPQNWAGWADGYTREDSTDGPDSIATGDGSDVVWAGGGDDAVSTGGGADFIYAGAGNDVVNAGSGDDSIQGGSGADTIHGGAGDDFICGFYVGIDAGLIMALDDDTGADGGGGESLHGDGGDDGIIASGAGNVLTGDDGNDNLSNAGDGGVLSGGTGNDILFADGDGNKLDGGDGDDFISSGTGASATGGGGNDVIYVGGSSHADGGGGDDTVNADGQSVVTGGSGNDTLGAGAHSVITGGSGDDIIAISSAEVRVDGGDGTDTLEPAAVPMHFRASTMTNVEIILLQAIGGGGGVDPNGAAAPAAYDIVLDDGNVAAGQSLKVDGSGLDADTAVTFDGSAETDGSFTILGGLTNDQLSGGAKLDVIAGGGGSDILHGGGGADVLYGGYEIPPPGQNFDDGAPDKLWGGPGSDSFIVGDGDVIEDIENGELVVSEGTFAGHAVAFHRTAPYSGEYTWISFDGKQQIWDVQSQVQVHSIDPNFDEQSIVLAQDDGNGGIIAEPANDLATNRFETSFGDAWSHKVGPRIDSLESAVTSFFVDLPKAVAQIELTDLFTALVIRHFSGEDLPFSWYVVKNDTRIGQIQTGAAATSQIIQIVIKAMTGGYDSPMQLDDDLFSVAETVLQYWTKLNLFPIAWAARDVIVNAIGVGLGGIVKEVEALAKSMQSGLGTNGDDTLHQGGSDQTIYRPGAGADTVTDGNGNAVVYSEADHADDSFSGGGGINEVRLLNVTGNARVDLRNGEITGAGLGHDTLKDFQNAVTGSGNDLLLGSDAANALSGGDGNDTISGGAGNDVLAGGAGDDLLKGGSGIDTADYSSSTDAVHVDLRQTAAQHVSDGQGSDTLNSIENVIGSSFEDTLIGSSGNNRLDGGDGNDMIDASAGGRDIVIGGDGDDTISFGTAFGSDDSVDGGDGNDTLSLTGDYSAGILLKHVQNVETIVLSGTGTVNLVSVDSTVADGAVLTVDATALNGALIFDGSHETDGSFVLRGGRSDDVLTGGRNGDVIAGGGGNDTITGGAGPDRLAGGAGADHYVYVAASDSTSTFFDTVSGFDPSDGDRFDLPGTVTRIDSPITAGTLSLTSFDEDLASVMAGLRAGRGVLFTPDKGDLAGDTFLVVDANGHAGYQPGQDFVFLLAKPGDLSGLSAAAFI